MAWFAAILPYLQGAATVLTAGAAVRAQTVGKKRPGVQAPAGMPDAEAQAAARRRQAAELAQRSGRASTILSDDDKKLGG